MEILPAGTPNPEKSASAVTGPCELFMPLGELVDVEKEIARLQKPRTIATSCQDVILEYFQEHEWLDHWLDGRITVTP